VLYSLAELIGEEIYDEFDTEGARHGEVTSYIPPQFISPGPPSLKRKGSAPQLSTHPDTLRPVTPARPTQRSSSVSGTPILRPIAIPAFKGLSFLAGRSRSAPPIPHDGNGRRTVSVQPTAPETINDEKLKPEASVDAFTTSSDEKLPEIVIVPPVDIPAAPAYLPLTIATPAPVPVSVGPIDDPARARQGASRSTSPGPSLSEALLRARRPASAHISGSNLATKGTRFKSSPLGVAEHVLRLVEQQQQTQARAPEEPRGGNVDGGENQNASSSASGASAGAGAEPQGE
jgi:metal transporter CNNM